jgi:hypothetical protein
MGSSLGFENPDPSDALREAVELALANFAQACAHDVSKDFKRTAAAQLEEAVIRLNDYILRNIIPPDINENHAVTPYRTERERSLEKHLPPVD